MRVKLQPASKCELPAYNPILPVTAITQIMLIANPNQVWSTKKQINIIHNKLYSKSNI